jgi:hypothetical protein
LCFPPNRDHGDCRGNVIIQLLSSEARDVLYWAMHPALYRRIHMVIKIARNSPAFFVMVDFDPFHYHS